MIIDLADQGMPTPKGCHSPYGYVIPSGFGLLHTRIYDLVICFGAVSEKTNRQRGAFGLMDRV